MGSGAAQRHSLAHIDFCEGGEDGRSGPAMTGGAAVGNDGRGRSWQ